MEHRVAALEGELKRQSEVERELRQRNAELTNLIETAVAERTASLRDAVSQLEAFAYSVSHDLRAPARAMQGFAKAVLEDYGASLPEEGRRYLSQIVSSGQRMDRLIQDILSYSRVGRQEAEFHSVPLDALVRELLRQTPEFGADRAQITIQGRLPDVIGHSSSIGQVISNLLHNAVKFVRPGVRPEVVIAAQQTQQQVRISIQDNGIGIKPQHQNKLFGLFARVHTETQYEGTGVGLAIVRKAVERMGGRVGVESDGVHGSRFWIELPAAAEPS